MSILEYKVLQVPHYSQKFPHLVRRVKVKTLLQKFRDQWGATQTPQKYSEGLWKTQSWQNLMDWAALNSGMQLGEEIKTTEDSTGDAAVITSYIIASWLEKSPTNRQSSVLNACSAWMSAPNSSTRNLVIRAPVRLTSPGFVLRWCGHLSSKPEMACVRPNWNTATEVINWQLPLDSEQKSCLNICLGFQGFCSNHQLFNKVKSFFSLC